MATMKIQTSLRLSDPLYAKLRALSAREQRSFNNLIEYVMQKYVDDYEREHGEITVSDEDLRA